MTDQNTESTAVPVGAATLRDIIMLKIQVNLFENALAESKLATIALHHRQIIKLPLMSDPDFTGNLVQDILTTCTAQESLYFHADSLLNALRNLLPAQPKAKAI